MQAPIKSIAKANPAKNTAKRSAFVPNIPVISGDSVSSSTNFLMSLNPICEYSNLIKSTLLTG